MLCEHVHLENVAGVQERVDGVPFQNECSPSPAHRDHCGSRRNNDRSDPGVADFAANAGRGASLQIVLRLVSFESTRSFHENVGAMPGMAIEAAS